MASSGLFKNGKELSPITVKHKIMQMRGWDEAEYTRQRKQLTKRITTFNALMQETGGEKITDTAVQILYKESKARKHFGANYQPAFRTAALHSMAATSGSKRGQKAIEKASNKFSGYVYDRFNGLITKNEGARVIYEKLKNDPVKLEKVLSKYANDMHAVIGYKKKKTQGEAIPFSTESYGSDNYETDVSSYLSDDEIENEETESVNLKEVNEDDLPF